jgi:uncharacterized protein YecT (DUF1311 family)
MSRLIGGCMRVGVVLAFLGLAFALPASAQTVEADTKAVLACLFKKGASSAALNQPVGCQGVLSGPCLPDAPNTSETVNCIARESAAWTNIMDKALKDTQAKMSKEKYSALKKRQRAWQKQLPSRCRVEDEGSLGLIEEQFCQLNLTAKRATVLYEVAQTAKKGGS